MAKKEEAGQGAPPFSLVQNQQPRNQERYRHIRESDTRPTTTDSRRVHRREIAGSTHRRVTCDGERSEEKAEKTTARAGDAPGRKTVGEAKEALPEAPLFFSLTASDVVAAGEGTGCNDGNNSDNPRKSATKNVARLVFGHEVGVVDEDFVFLFETQLVPRDVTEEKRTRVVELTDRQLQVYLVLQARFEFVELQLQVNVQVQNHLRSGEIVAGELVSLFGRCTATVHTLPHRKELELRGNGSRQQEYDNEAANRELRLQVASSSWHR